MYELIRIYIKDIYILLWLLLNILLIFSNTLFSIHVYKLFKIVIIKWHYLTMNRISIFFTFIVWRDCIEVTNTPINNWNFYRNKVNFYFLKKNVIIIINAKIKIFRIHMYIVIYYKNLLHRLNEIDYRFTEIGSLHVYCFFNK